MHQSQRAPLAAISPNSKHRNASPSKSGGGGGLGGKLAQHTHHRVQPWDDGKQQVLVDKAQHVAKELGRMKNLSADRWARFPPAHVLCALSSVPMSVSPLHNPLSAGSSVVLSTFDALWVPPAGRGWRPKPTPVGSRRSSTLRRSGQSGRCSTRCRSRCRWRLPCSHTACCRESRV